jgi:hypothetical protein
VGAQAGDTDWLAAAEVGDTDWLAAAGDTGSLAVAEVGAQSVTVTQSIPPLFGVVD